jgi:LPS O-antigen subunit length determinant protein (WzzB/FepE family)
MSEQSYSPIPEDEISLKDIIDFLVESWKTIVLTGLLGIVGSTVYLWVTPNQYQAIAQIQMAQISANNNTNPLGVNIEDPYLLMARLKLPTNYASEEIKACSSEDTKSSSEDLANSAKFSVVKGVGPLVELKINRDSKESAITCAQALFDSIKTSQNAIIKPFIEEAKDLLVKYQDRLKNSQSLISRADKSGAALSAAYLANRDEVKFLSEEILRLNTFIASADTRQAKLVSPIYASDIPVAPNKRKVLIAGLFGGLFLGLLLMLGKRVLTAYKTANLKS